MAERYSSTSLDSGKNISEIKSTPNDLATRLERSQLKAGSPERKTVQFSEINPTRAYSSKMAPAAPIRNFNAQTGQ